MLASYIFISGSATPRLCPFLNQDIYEQLHKTYSTIISFDIKLVIQLDEVTKDQIEHLRSVTLVHH
uniref:Uncharacterized protein n=1 Tax=Megaselia scalaris TaxID=36166 RepID=T1GDR7_MEGSC